MIRGLVLLVLPQPPGRGQGLKVESTTNKEYLIIHAYMMKLPQNPKE